MEDKLRLIEERIDALIGELRRLREENESLRGDALKLRGDNSEMKKRLNQLESEMDSGRTKEGEVRERLRSIIEKIDAIEKMSSQ